MYPVVHNGTNRLQSQHYVPKFLIAAASVTVTSLFLSGTGLLSSLFMFCWNFFMSKTLNGLSGSKIPFGIFSKMSLETALSFEMFLILTAVALHKRLI